MAATYTHIEQSEMSQFLEGNGFEFYDDTQAQEYVFQKYVDKDGIKYTLRVYTSISRYNDAGRRVGTDAIRVVVLGDNRYFGESRVNRTQNWRDNLKKRIESFKTSYKTCPQCGHALRPKTGKFGKFMGCVTYPACGYTESVKQ